MQPSFDKSVAALDTSIFCVQTETSLDDRRSFLAIQDALRASRKEYVYLECGSHLGGSLVPHLLDPHCRVAYSVDKRPPSQPDERGTNFRYPENSSQRMISILAQHIPANCLEKLRIFDKSASELTVSNIPDLPDLVLIDAEHTNAAVFSDFLNLYGFCHRSTVYVFHDANLTFPALQNIEMFLRYSRVDFNSYVLPSVVYLLALNEARETLRSVGEKFQLEKAEFARRANRQIIMSHYELVRKFLSDREKLGDPATNGPKKPSGSSQRF